MREEKTFNQWLREWGYTWVEGREQFIKGTMTAPQAQDYLTEEHARGNIKNGR